MRRLARTSICRNRTAPWRRACPRARNATASCACAAGASTKGHPRRARDAAGGAAAGKHQQGAVRVAPGGNRPGLRSARCCERRRMHKVYPSGASTAERTCTKHSSPDRRLGSRPSRRRGDAGHDRTLAIADPARRPGPALRPTLSAHHDQVSAVDRRPRAATWRAAADLNDADCGSVGEPTCAQRAISSRDVFADAVAGLRLRTRATACAATRERG